MKNQFKKKNKVLAIIPARSGSKGVPHKNLMTFEGKSLMQRALECALGTNAVDKIIINSDSQKILDSTDASINSNKIIKQLRPKSLGKDNSSIVDVVLHAIDHIEEYYDLILLLQVTSPLRTSLDIEKIIQFFLQNESLEAVLSVVPVNDNHPARMYKINEDDRLATLDDSHETQHRQDLQEVFLRNGCFYAIKSNVLKQQKTFMPKIKKPYVMNPEHFLNIDSPRDVIIGKALIKAWENNNL